MGIFAVLRVKPDVSYFTGWGEANKKVR